MDLPRRSPLGLVILGMLIEEPMHAYRLQKLIQARGKDTVVNVRQRTSVHQVLDRLLRFGLIEVLETGRAGGRPDRTVYRITPDGRRVAEQWLCEALTSVGEEFPEFPAGVSMIVMLAPDQARAQFEIRAAKVRAELARLEAVKRSVATLPRLFLLEDDYQATLLTAELGWLRTVIADLASGALTWDEAWVRGIGAEFTPPETD
jgi:DNA-binding PadR family transcriptional regulator